MKLAATDKGRAGRKGFSLLEVMVAAAIAGILCAGVVTVMYRTEHTGRYLYDCTVATRAAHQTMEILLADDMDSMILQNGNTFTVSNLTCGSTGGTITITDLGWMGSDQAYQLRVRVDRFGVDLSSVRTRT